MATSYHTSQQYSQLGRVLVMIIFLSCASKELLLFLESLGKKKKTPPPKLSCIHSKTYLLGFRSKIYTVKKLSSSKHIQNLSCSHCVFEVFFSKRRDLKILIAFLPNVLEELSLGFPLCTLSPLPYFFFYSNIVSFVTQNIHTT